MGFFKNSARAGGVAASSITRGAQVYKTRKGKFPTLF